MDDDIKPLPIEQINALPEAACWWPIGMNDRIVRLLRAVERAAVLADREQRGEPVGYGQIGLMNGQPYVRMQYDREPYPPPPSIIKNLNLVPLYAAPQPDERPIDMVLHCPACGMQHIDEPEGEGDDEATVRRLDVWTNPPHRSHLCHGCGHIWRPADVATNGVAETKTRGKSDSPPASARKPLTEAEVWSNEDLMAANAKAGLLMADLVNFIRAVERAHGITGEQS